MSTLRCPNCNQWLPESTSICIACGYTLLPGTDSQTILRARDVHAFNTGQNGQQTEAEEQEEDISLSSSPSSPRKMVSSLHLPTAQELAKRGTNWHQEVTSRTSHPMPRLQQVPPPRTPLTSEYLVEPQPEPRTLPPSLMFWASIPLLLILLVGSIFGMSSAFGRSDRPAISTSTDMTLQISPSSVAPGGMLTLRGSHFTPGTKIGLSRDTGSIPVVDTAGNTIISATVIGSFSDTVIVDPTWRAGPHIIHAEDAIRHKIASFTVMVTGNSSQLRPAHLLLSASNIDLGSADQATNSTKQLTLTNAGDGEISWQTSMTQPWLQMTPQRGIFASGQKTTITIAANRSNLKPGAYQGQILFQSNAGNVALTVKMQTTLLQAGHAPVLQLTPAVLSFAGVDGGNPPPDQIVTVSNPGVLPLTWEASVRSEAGWLSVSPQTGTVESGNSQAVRIGVNTSTLLPGTYNGSITFNGQGPAAVKDSPQTIYVTLTVAPQCTLQTSPTSLTFTGVYQGSAPAPRNVNLTVSQGCSTPIRWTASSGNTGWLHINTGSGTTPANPVVSVNTTGLQVGAYTGTIIFSTATGTLTLPVTLTIIRPSSPALSVTPATMSFSSIEGQDNAGTQALTIANIGGDMLSWHASPATNSGGSWLQIDASSGTLSANQTTAIHVTATALSGMAPGTYTGVVLLTATDSAGQAAGGSPQNVSVTYTLQPPCTIGLSSAAFSFSGVIGQANPVSQSVSISASGTCQHALAWTARNSADWITTSPSAGTVSLQSNSSTSIGVNLASLSPTTYTGTVTITAIDSVSGQTIGSQTVNVSLNVQPPCTLQAASSSAETFEAEAGTNPTSQTFTIGITGTCNGSVTITPVATGGSWLSVSPSSATISSGSATFTVSIAAASLAPDTYTGSISISAINNGMALVNSPQTIGVSLHITTPPSLTVSPTTGLSFTLATGTASQNITISNGGGEPLNWSAVLSAGAPAFVSLSNGNGNNLAAGTNTTIIITVDATGLSGGSTYTTGVAISATDAITGIGLSTTPITIPISITISSPAMQVAATTLTFSTIAGVNPAAQSLALVNNGGDVLTWSSSIPSQAWVVLPTTSGSISAASSVSIPVAVNITELAAGSYTATFVITPSIGNAVTINVDLNINSSQTGASNL